VKEVKEIPAATLVLVAKSKFFQGMFQGEFSERHNKASVNIYISEEDEDHFNDLIYFMYSATVPQHAAQSFSACVRLLVLADRFDVQDCVDEVLELLAAFIPRLSPEDALQLLSLPESVQQALSLGDIVDKAKRKLVETYSVLLSSPSDASFLSNPRSLPPRAAPTRTALKWRQRTKLSRQPWHGSATDTWTTRIRRKLWQPSSSHASISRRSPLR